MSAPRNAAAPGWETEGEAKTQQGHADTLIVPSDPGKHQDAPGPSTPEEREARARRARRRLRENIERSKASRRLSALIADMREARQPSTYLLPEAELRAYANALVRDGWTVDEVLARLDLPRPGVRA